MSKISKLISRVETALSLSIMTDIVSVKRKKRFKIRRKRKW